MEEARLYYTESFSLKRRLISTEEANLYGDGGLFQNNRAFVVVVVVVVFECLHLYGKQEPLHRGRDEFLYRSLQRGLCCTVSGSRVQVGHRTLNS